LKQNISLNEAGKNIFAFSASTQNQKQVNTVTSVLMASNTNSNNEKSSSANSSDNSAGVIFILFLIAIFLWISLRIRKIKLKRISDVNKKLESEINSIKSKLNFAESKISSFDYSQKKLDSINTDITESRKTLEAIKKDIEKYEKSSSASAQKNSRELIRLNKTKDLLEAINYSLENYFKTDLKNEKIILSETIRNEIQTYSPTVELDFKSSTLRDLRKAYKDNESEINNLVSGFERQYTTKANKSIYALMVMGVKAELQNVITKLKYNKLEDSEDRIRDIIQKYQNIADEGNKTLYNSILRFLGALEYLLLNAVKIEYNYYIRKEQQRQEQLELKAKLREEKEEREALAREKKKIEAEELKYKQELEKIRLMVNDESITEKEELRKRILELEGQLSSVAVKKNEISELANGLAGTVYVISNLGSFGDNVFKIGMTRRLEPSDRINELSSASLPFKFDVHSFIFTDNAVQLENELHKRLNEYRLNKVNFRKEFFKISIDELEKVVYEIQPTAEFNRTMLAEDFKISSDEKIEAHEIEEDSYSEESDED